MSSNRPDFRSVLSCTDCVNAMFACVAPGAQFDSYWRHGQFDTCARPAQELYWCMKLKFADQDTARAMVEQLAQEPPNPTIGSIWSSRLP